MSIKIEHRNLEIRKTRNDFSVQVRNFLLPLSLKVLRPKERDTHSFYSGFFIWPPHTISCDTCPRPTQASESQPSSAEAVLNSTNWFFKIPKSSVRFRCVTLFALASPVSHLDYCDISEWHVCSTRARAWTPVLMLHLSNPCIEPKGSQSN